MAEIILVTGGTRSGKSEYAQKRAEVSKEPRCFIATCVVSDEEMSDRVKKHQQQRAESQWITCEEPLELEKAIAKNNDCATFLIDCITLWVSNMMYDCREKGIECTEQTVETLTIELMDALKDIAGRVILVTNEVGWGIVPDNEPARRYRDLVGRCNQIIASYADEVVMISCGLPLPLKERSHEPT